MSLFSDARNIVSLTTRHSDLALVGLLVAVIALMIMPLPTALVDTLIGGVFYERNDVIDMMLTDGNLQKLQAYLKKHRKERSYEQEER